MSHTTLRRHRIQRWYELVERCRATLTAARADLGPDLGGGSEVDLLLDNHPELKDAGEARNALDYIYGRKGNPRTLAYLRGTA